VHLIWITFGQSYLAIDDGAASESARTKAESIQEAVDGALIDEGLTV